MPLWSLTATWRISRDIKEFDLKFRALDTFTVPYISLSFSRACFDIIILFSIRNYFFCRCKGKGDNQKVKVKLS